MSKVQLFNFGAKTLRVVELGGQTWFHATDTCYALGFNMSAGASPHLKRVAADEKLLITGRSHPDLKLGTAPTATVISESGLYKMVLASRKPEAKAFQEWVTRVVLPAIRKDGAYVMGEEKVATGEMSEDELVLKALGIMQRKLERLAQERDQLFLSNSLLKCENNHLEQQNQRIAPDAQVGHAVAKRKALGVVDFCRKLPGVSVNAIQTRLYDMQYLHKKHGHWSVYAKFKGNLFDESFSDDGYSKVIVLEAGQRKLVSMYHAGLLPMLKGRTPERHLELVL